MLIASLIVSLLGVLAAGLGAYLAFNAKAADYTRTARPTGESSRMPLPVAVAFWYLIRDQRKAAAWVLLGAALQFVSVLLALLAST